MEPINQSVNLKSQSHIRTRSPKQNPRPRKLLHYTTLHYTTLYYITHYMQPPSPRAPSPPIPIHIQAWSKRLRPSTLTNATTPTGLADAAVRGLITCPSHRACILYLPSTYVGSGSQPASQPCLFLVSSYVALPITVYVPMYVRRKYNMGRVRLEEMMSMDGKM